MGGDLGVDPATPRTESTSEPVWERLEILEEEHEWKQGHLELSVQPSRPFKAQIGQTRRHILFLGTDFLPQSRDNQVQ